MPPEVREAERARASQRILGLSAIVVVVLLAGGFGAAALRASQAADSLVEAQQRTLSISAQKVKYKEATTLGDLVQTVTQARMYAVSSEVLWSTYYDSISRALPSGVVLASAVMAGHSPWVVPAASVQPLAQPSIAGISFVVVSASVLDQTALARSMSGLKGFAGSSIDSVTNNKGVYSAKVNVALSTAALSGRFSPVEASAAKK